jgi:hypothetical protein
MISGIKHRKKHLLNGHQAGAEEILDAIHSWRWQSYINPNRK